MSTKKGLKKYIETPDKLWEHFIDYVNYLRANPLFKNEIRGLNYDLVQTPIARPITFSGFEIYLHTNKIISHLGDYEMNKDGRYTEYAPIIKKIKAYCANNMLEGAVVGLFKENIVSRILGLTDKNEVNIKTEQPLFNLDNDIIDKE